MAHIVMFGVDAVSHTLPSLEILGELVRRGHRVEVVNDPAQRDLAGVPPRALALVPRAMQPHATGSSYTDRPDFYRECVTAFGGRPGWHLVLQVGRRTDLDAIGDLPTGVEARRWVPQLAILLADTLVELGVARRLDTAAATARALPGRPTSSRSSCADATRRAPVPVVGASARRRAAVTQSRVRRRCVTRCGRAASSPRRSILLAS